MAPAITLNIKLTTNIKLTRPETTPCLASSGVSIGA
jgi:hypothetical protein